MTEKEVKMNKEPFREFGLKLGEGFEFTVLSDFFLKTKNGHLQPVKIGDRVVLGNETALGLLHSNRIMPLFLPEKLFVQLKTPVTYVTEASEYETFHPGMIISVNRTEALPLLLKRQVEPIEESLREKFAELLRR